jgi:hypothetical protein
VALKIASGPCIQNGLSRNVKEQFASNFLIISNSASVISVHRKGLNYFSPSNPENQKAIQKLLSVSK